jgi:integrase
MVGAADGFLFGDDKPFSRRDVDEARRMFTKAGLEPICLHELRHSFVSNAHAFGLSLEEIGDYVGHTTTYMTDRYRHLVKGQREAAALKLAAFGA